MRANAAHHLACGLGPGDDCPVCLRPLESLPAHATPPGLDEAQVRVEKAAAARDRAAHAAREAFGAHQADTRTMETLREALAELGGKLEGQRSKAALGGALKRIEQAETAHARACSAAERSRQAERTARERLDRCNARVRAAWETFRAKREGCAALTPPRPDPGDLLVAWEALLDWAAGARLRELSNGDYSLRLDERMNFEVVDHKNAEEARPVRTLSGGETFLASLALALALADQVADLAAEGAARLETIFLDEGFGTLDAETLETATATIEELGARGRVVGLVTHVKELADRIPVQYRVLKGPQTSTVERVAS